MCEAPAFAEVHKKADGGVIQLKGKRSSTDQQPLTWISSKRRSPLMSFSNNTKQQYHRPKNCLMAEFESLLTDISEEKRV